MSGIKFLDPISEDVRYLDDRDFCTSSASNLLWSIRNNNCLSNPTKLIESGNEITSNKLLQMLNQFLTVLKILILDLQVLHHT